MVQFKQHKLVQFRRPHFFFTKMVVNRELWIQLEVLSYETITRLELHSMMYYNIQYAYSSLITHSSNHSLKFQKFSSILNFSNFTTIMLFFFPVLIITGVFGLMNMTYLKISTSSTSSFEKQHWSNFSNSPLFQHHLVVLWLQKCNSYQ